jgi:phosphatidylserine/phosphatidylglycerophosphate/cardiolipin synthase-like enzyme
MTNSPANNGNPFGASDYIINRDKILQTGAKIYEYEGGISYHGKSITIDDNISIIGSFNMDLRSVYLSTETMVVIDSEEINKQLKEYFKTYEEDAVYIIDKDRIEIPKGVVRQEFTEKKKLLIRIISRFNWLRFLM